MLKQAEKWFPDLGTIVSGHLLIYVVSAKGDHERIIPGVILFSTRLCIEWLLLTTFMSFFVVKVFHHETKNAVSTSCSDTHHSYHLHNACDDCAVCKYSLSLFTEADSSDFILILPLVPYERVTYPEKIAYALSYSHYLRGPPVA